MPARNLSPRLISALAGALLPVMALVGPAGAQPLQGSEWRLKEGSDKIFLQFGADGKLAGSGGCNRFFAEYTLGMDNALTIGPIGATKMMCAEADMSREQDFFERLKRVAWFSRDGGLLVLTSSVDVVMLELVQRDRD